MDMLGDKPTYFEELDISNKQTRLLGVHLEAGFVGTAKIRYSKSILIHHTQQYEIKKNIR